MSSTMKSSARSSADTRRSENSSSSTLTYEDRKAEYARIQKRAKQAIERLED